MEEFFLPRNVPMTPNMRERDGSRNLFGFARENVTLPNLQSSRSKSPMWHPPSQSSNRHLDS